jgi:DNA-binding response OmpR family regulator
MLGHLLGGWFIITQINQAKRHELEFMADVKKVLVVDDHFEMLELLRSMLELSNDQCEVLAVPSAEEGLLELRRTPFDLVITDVRLPGMSGFDLVRRIQKLKRDKETPVIMITAYSSTEGQKEAKELGVLRYFPKPLDTDAVLMAVQTALHGELADNNDSGVEYRLVDEITISEDVHKRLQTLRTDTGATGLMLATTRGKVLFEATTRRLDFGSLAINLAEQVKQSFTLSQYLDGDLPNTIQYHAGETVELYCANVNQDYFLTIFFDVQSRRGRIGTIWVFTQRAIKDLVAMLPPLSGAPTTTPGLARTTPVKTAVRPTPPPEKPAPAPIRHTTPPPAKAKPTPPPPDPPAKLVQDEEIAALIKAMMTAQQEEPTLEPEADLSATGEWLDLDPAILDDLFENDLPDDNTEVETNPDLDAFWDNALNAGA